ncbi:NAD(P)/FAD-dependent oxidoreductase [Candidatus Uhrbacteria bacterium]|nr:NAD(P)/FAD-dependent oxidoreductase [Candidatus Uhrbacteria bacterium]
MTSTRHHGLNPPPLTRIAVVGAGFGGVYAFKKLHSLFHGKRHVELVLINKEKTFLFTPLLHEVATGGMSGENVVEPLRKLFRCCSKSIVIAQVKSISCKKQTIETTAGDIPFDYCILAPGSQTNFFNTPGAEKQCFTLKTQSDALQIKKHFIELCERAVHEKDEKELEAMMRTVIIGGGATGVELAAETAEYVYDTFPKYYRHTSFLKKASIVLVHRGKELIPQFCPQLRKRALSILRKKGVDVRLETAVKAVREGHVELSSGEKLYNRTAIWVAGVAPVHLECENDLPYTSTSHLPVNECLQVTESQNIYVIGDAALCTDEKGCPIPGLAQSAVQQGGAAALNIYNAIQGKPLKKFIYKSRGSLLSLGQGMAIAEIGKLHFSGSVAWFVWRTVYFFKLLSWDHQVKVGIDWFLDIFRPRDITDI